MGLQGGIDQDNRSEGTQGLPGKRYGDGVRGVMYEVKFVLKSTVELRKCQVCKVSVLQRDPYLTSDSDTSRTRVQDP